MSKPQGTFGNLARVAFLVLMAFLVLAEPVLFLIFFVPVAAWFLWRDHDKIVELERRLAANEKPDEKSGA